MRDGVEGWKTRGLERPAVAAPQRRRQPFVLRLASRPAKAFNWPGGKPRRRAAGCGPCLQAYSYYG